MTSSDINPETDELMESFRNRESTLRASPMIEIDNAYTLFKKAYSTKEHPLMVFGPGVYQFFKIVEMLIWVFFVLSIIACFQIKIIKDATPGYLD